MESMVHDLLKGAKSLADAALGFVRGLPLVGPEADYVVYGFAVYAAGHLFGFW